MLRKCPSCGESIRRVNMEGIDVYVKGKAEFQGVSFFLPVLPRNFKRVGRSVFDKERHGFWRDERNEENVRPRGLRISTFSICVLIVVRAQCCARKIFVIQ